MPAIALRDLPSTQVFIRATWLLFWIVGPTATIQTWAQDPGQDAAPKLDNGDFANWEESGPQGWTVEIGASNGASEPASEVRQMVGPAIYLQGNAKTMAWQSVSQEVAVEGGQTYQLDFEARSKDIRREGKQFDNCYVGWMSMDAAGKVIGRELQDVSSGAADWTKFALSYTVPQNAKSTSVMIFLSKSGVLAVKDMSITQSARPENLAANGDFGQWEKGVPKSWTVEIAARNGANRPESTVKKLPGGGVELAGNARTLAWNSISQDLDVTPGETYSIEVEAAAQGIRREGRQFDNCYVGVMSFDANGNRLDMALEDLSKLRGWKKQSIRFVPPPKSAKTTLLIFLSKTGSLKIKNVYVGSEVPRRPFR